MRPPKTYWLSDSRGVTGPYALSQIRPMWERGGIVASAMVAENNGKERWESIGAFIRRKEGGGVSVWEGLKKLAVLGLAAIGVLLAAGFALKKAGDSLTPGDRTESSAKRWARSNLADRDAEVVGMGEPHKHQGEIHRVIRIRGKNAFGGPVINDFIAHVSERGDIIFMWRPKEFFEVQRMRIRKSKPEAQAGESAALERFAAALGFRSLASGD